ncbi:MAG: hypothetical protein SOY56_04890 [Anaerovoracaceae bacterium]|nr:hypothetical protein [Anaerovoracaceae bacterium]
MLQSVYGLVSGIGRRACGAGFERRGRLCGAPLALRGAGAADDGTAL